MDEIGTSYNVWIICGLFGVMMCHFEEVFNSRTSGGSGVQI